MSWIQNLTDFQPVRLIHAREAVVVEHPGTAAEPAAMPVEMLPALKSRVAAASGDLFKLERLALELSPREVRGLVTGLEQWDDLRVAVRVLLSRRMRTELLLPLWRAWQRFPTVPDVRSILLEYVEALGWQTIIPHGLSGVARTWIASEQPGAEIQRWLDLQGRTYSELRTGGKSPFLPETPLLRLVRNAVMIHGSTKQLRTEGALRLRAWSGELDPTNWVLFGRNYLIRIPTEEWDRSILDCIEQEYGLPKKTNTPSFWSPVPDEIKRAFQRVFIRDKLRKALGHDPERQAYWQRWEDHIIDVEFGTARDVPFSTFDFGGFGVVEFYVTGNAAYLYTPSELAMLKRKRVRTVEDLKVRHESVAFTPGQDNRIIHSGNWPAKASLKVRAWLRHTTN